MKTKDIIKTLQDLDPDGNLECSVGGIDIVDISVFPAGYDGFQEVITGPNSGKYIGTQPHIDFYTMSFKDKLLDNHTFQIDYSDLHPVTAKHYKERMEQIRLYTLIKNYKKKYTSLLR